MSCFTALFFPQSLRRTQIHCVNMSCISITWHVGGSQVVFPKRTQATPYKSAVTQYVNAVRRIVTSGRSPTTSRIILTEFLFRSYPTTPSKDPRTISSVISWIVSFHLRLVCVSVTVCTTLVHCRILEGAYIDRCIPPGLFWFAMFRATWKPSSEVQTDRQQNFTFVKVSRQRRSRLGRAFVVVQPFRWPCHRFLFNSHNT